MELMTIGLSEPISNEIIFTPGSGQSWIMKLTKEGVFFNRDKWPDLEPDAFAQAVVEILETRFDVTFNRKNPPYDRE